MEVDAAALADGAPEPAAVRAAEGDAIAATLTGAGDATATTAVAETAAKAR